VNNLATIDPHVMPGQNDKYYPGFTYKVFLNDVLVATKRKQFFNQHHFMACINRWNEMSNNSPCCDGIVRQYRYEPLGS